MDSLAFAKTHSSEWERLDELAKRRRLSGQESDEFVRLYQRAATHLATVRTQAPDPDVVLYLSAILGRARSRLTQSSGGTWASVADFFNVTLPIAFYRIRWWVLGVTLGFVGVFLVVLIHYHLNPELVTSMGSLASLEHYADTAFEAYYSEYANADFAALVWTNNAWIALQCVAGGITGVFPAFVLWQNAVSIGQSAAVMNYFDSLDIFFQLILPHGLLELTAIFVAGAAGLRLFWVLLVPGDRPRVDALATEGRQTVTVGIGLVFVLFVSGLVEGFVTPSGLEWWLKIVIGALVLAAFWAWVILLGRSGLARGLSADQAPADAGWTVEYSA